ncbi:MAG: hypothetical protein AAAB35_14370 [Phyllobacterium sp.]|uniref:hypothetical protein n=1 Tax=Phyllobacterium sp. TaxID=1871046 RepID=UPI0030F0D8F2
MFTAKSTVVPLDPSTRSESGSGDLKNPRVQQEIIRAFNRIWRAHMSLAEYGMMGFILDATIGWGFTSRLFTSRFIENGDQRHCGTGLTDRSIRRTIANLEAKRFIVVDRSDMTKGLRITPNINWTPEEAMLPVSKRLKQAQVAAAHNSGMDDGRSETHENTVATPDKNVRPLRPKMSGH